MPASWKSRNRSNHMKAAMKFYVLFGLPSGFVITFYQDKEMACGNGMA
jgi:hypothetical protein